LGREAACRARIGRASAEGRLLLETDDLIFRGEPRLVVPLATIARADARAGWLEIEHARGVARFELGDAAEKWAHAINNPRTRIDKLDVKPGSRVAIVDLDDEDFLEELRQRTGPSDGPPSQRDYDLIFFGVTTPAALPRLNALRARIAPAGAVWIITPKGVPSLSHGPVVAAARAAGLVDVKTARFTATHTALKLMIPRDRR
jgi:hypothetical protein